MNRNTLYLIVGALVVAVIFIGFRLYQAEQEPSLEIEVNDSGLSVETN